MRRSLALLVVPLVAGALLLVWWAPWNSSPDAVTRARKAFGDGRVVHIVVRTGISPRAVATRPVLDPREAEIWVDPAPERTHIVERRAGQITRDVVEASRTSAAPAPAVLFAIKYRPELGDAVLRDAGSGRVQNRRVVWLQSRDLRVAVDPVSYLPLWLASPDAGGAAPLTQIAFSETKPLDPADFLTAKQKRARHL